MKKLHKILIGLGAMAVIIIILLIVSLAIVIRRQAAAMEKAIGQPKKNTAADWQWVLVTAEQLVADYRANEITADEKYKSQHLIVTGRVGRITSEYMTLDVSDQITDVQCIYKIGKSGADNLVRGQERKCTGSAQVSCRM